MKLAIEILRLAEEFRDKVIPSGMELWFEYHCNESPSSADAEAWYHSHQKVTVIECETPELASDRDADTFEKRSNNAEGLMYKVRFRDGLVWTVFEDELLESPNEFEREDPPKKPIRG